MASTKKVTLKTWDGKTFNVDVAVALQFQTIKPMIEDGCPDNGISLPKITGNILAKVIEYCEKHVETQKDAVEERATEDELKSWDAEFVKVDKAVLYDLIMAASYLDIKNLLHLTTKTVANKLEGKNPKEIKNGANKLKGKNLKEIKNVANKLKGKNPEEECEILNSKDDFTSQKDCLPFKNWFRLSKKKGGEQVAAGTPAGL